MAKDQKHDADAENPDSTAMAKDRTDWAEDRTVLANERTFAGWMRTGMGSIAVALALRALFGEFQPTWIPKAVSTLFIALAIFVFWSARQTASATLRHMDEHAAASQETWRVTAMASIFSVGAVLTGLVLWWL